MKSSLKSFACLLLSGLWLLSYSPAHSEPTGIFKATCDQIVESLKAHQWTEAPGDSDVYFPYFQKIAFTKSGAKAMAYTINGSTARIFITLPRIMLQSGLKEIYQKLGLPESAPSPDLNSIGFPPTLVDGGDENWVMLTYQSGELWIVIGPTSFYRSAEDFKDDKIKPELCNARANEIAEDLAPH